MFKIIFVLVLSTYHGGINTDLKFNSLANCESAKVQLAENHTFSNSRKSISASCLEMQVPIKKTKCKIVNQTDYTNARSTSYAHNMDNYPYPIALECEEQ